MSREMDQETKQVVAKVKKLLRLAARNPNQAEAATAAAKAQELLAAYNLDMAAVAEHGNTDAQRAKELYEGGKHKWEREIWSWVARLNFCLHWAQENFYETPLGIQTGIVKNEDGSSRIAKGIRRWEHKIVGRRVNVIATKHMASYLSDVTKRLTKEECVKRGIPVRSGWANSFSEGVGDEIAYRLAVLRQERIDGELAAEKKAREEALDAAKASGFSAATALTLSTYTDQEHDQNIDFVYGEGTSARWAAERARRAAAARAADEAYTKWAQDNPKEAAKEERRRQREHEKLEAAAARKEQRRRNWGAYSAGVVVGEKVPLNPQTEGRQTPAGLLQ